MGVEAGGRFSITKFKETFAGKIYHFTFPSRNPTSRARGVQFSKEKSLNSDR